MPVIGHDAPARNPRKMAGMGLKQDIVKCEEGVLAGEPHPAVGAAGRATGESGGSGAKRSGHGRSVSEDDGVVNGPVASVTPP
jgi:hypothetical protein